MEICLIGLKTRNTLHKNWYFGIRGLKCLAFLSPVEIELVALRCQGQVFLINKFYQALFAPIMHII